jgi:hypothetical protein
MWWCCGKTKKTSAGCKFQKHVSKEDYNDDDEDQQIIQFKLKCPLCNKHGHKAYECDKDPNIRTTHDTEGEIQRVEKLMQLKKKYNDNFTITQQLFYKMSLLSNERVTTQALTQDDFSYNQFND